MLFGSNVLQTKVRDMPKRFIYANGKYFYGKDFIFKEKFFMLFCRKSTGLLGKQEVVKQEKVIY